MVDYQYVMSSPGADATYLCDIPERKTDILQCRYDAYLTATFNPNSLRLQMYNGWGYVVQRDWGSIPKDDYLRNTNPHDKDQVFAVSVFIGSCARI